MRKSLAALMLGLSLWTLAGCNRLQHLVGRSHDDRIKATDALFLDGNQGNDWPGYGRTFGEQHFSPLTEINDRNVRELGLAWSMDLGPGNPASQPLEVGGRLYFATGESIVHAVDARTGKLLWQYAPVIPADNNRGMRVTWGIRGMAWWDGKVYVGTVDGRLLALDAKTGQLLWSVQTTTKGDGRFVTGAPRAFDGKIIVGQGGGDTTTTRAYATAYDAETGKLVWRFYIVPGDPAKGFENKAMAMAAKTWTGEWWKLGGGGHPWNAFAFDKETNTILIGTGNGYPWNQKVRSPGGGDNLFLCAVVAVDATTGAYKWHYQYNPGETWDYNAAMDIELADLTIDGKPRKVMLQAPKNGFLYVIDRTNGQLISAAKIARVTWATGIDMKTGRPIEVPGARFPNGQSFDMWPATEGAHSWQPMAYSPETKLLYIPKIEQGFTYSDKGFDLKSWKPTGGPNDAESIGPPTPNKVLNTSALLALNPATQKLAWKVDTIGGWTGGVLATAGNLIFQGQMNGKFAAYAADTGKELWHFDAQAPVVAAPISYSTGGKQYVTVLVGAGTSPALNWQADGGVAIDARTQKKRVLTFILDGTAKLPPAPPRFAVKPVADPGFKEDAALTAKGQSVFSAHCITCHGWQAIAGGEAPDLRGSPVPLSPEALDSIVRGGALVANGMPKFGELSDQEMIALRQYIRSRMNDLRAGRLWPVGGNHWTSYTMH